MFASLSRRALLLALVVLAAGCDTQDRADSCREEATNLLRDPGVESLLGPRGEHQWSISEHAAMRSFEYRVEGGVLTIGKTGSEPWALVSQYFRDPGLAGKTVRYSAEVQLDLSPPIPEHGFKPGGGLTLLAQSNGRAVARSTLEHQPHMGKSDWVPVSVELRLPGNTNQLRAGILHQANGVLRIRKPWLSLAECVD